MSTRAVSFEAIGTTAVLATTDPDALGGAEAILRRQLEELDLACSRFRPDSEVVRLRQGDGSPSPVSDVLFEALSSALRLADETGGAVDPTVGSALESLGYDRDFALVGAAAAAGDSATGRRARRGDSGSRSGRAVERVPGFWSIRLDAERREVTLPPGTLLDLGSTAKAWAADRAATTIADTLGVGTLVSLGGDVSVGGVAPSGGWPVGIARHCRSGPDEVTEVVSVSAGGLASSSTEVRAWWHAGTRRHHIVDPATGASAGSQWRLVSVMAPSCAEANAFATASVVWGEGALDRLPTSVACRLVAADGSVVYRGAWA